VALQFLKFYYKKVYVTRAAYMETENKNLTRERKGKARVRERE